MEFNLPTTIDEMYNTLSEIYYYYRVRREGYEDAELGDLILQRMQYQPPTDLELKEKAKVLLSAQFEREKSDYILGLSTSINGINLKITATEQNAQKRVEEITDLYADSVQKVESKAIKAGLINSSIVADKTANLETAKNQAILNVLEEKDQTIATLNAERQTLQTKMDGVDEYFSVIYDKAVEAKTLELIDERDKIVREVFKYNNALDEKEKRYANTVKQAEATLKLQFLEISMGEFTKDQLVDMGYYTDVIRCISGYFDRLSAVDAFYAVTAEKRLVVYLDDMYADFVYGYRARAGL